ncbi:MAG: hypothetical protein JF615_04325 [Asticcacaulis sp.]|nr:hypothetical protein [Asticcacaulis sp.]
MNFSQMIIDLALRILPQHRQSWGKAMRHECLVISDRDEALTFAFGCLWAALQERIRVMDLIVRGGRLSVGLVTALYGGLFLSFALNGLTQPQLRNPHVPWLISWQVAMGVTHIAAAICLILWKPKAFGAACIAAAAAALPLVVLGMGQTASRPLAFAWPFVPLTLLVLAAVFFDQFTRTHASR